MGVSVAMSVAVMMRFGRRSGESERQRRNQGSGRKTDRTNESRIPFTPRHGYAPHYASNRWGSCLKHTHERYGDAVTGRLT